MPPATFASWSKLPQVDVELRQRINSPDVVAVAIDASVPLPRAAEALAPAAQWFELEGRRVAIVPREVVMFELPAVVDELAAAKATARSGIVDRGEVDGVDTLVPFVAPDPSPPLLFAEGHPLPGIA